MPLPGGPVRVVSSRPVEYRVSLARVCEESIALCSWLRSEAVPGPREEQGAPMEAYLGPHRPFRVRGGCPRMAWIRAGSHCIGGDLALARSVGANFVAKANPFAEEGSARCSSQFATGPFPVTRAWTYIPSMASMARRPFLISFVWSSTSESGSSENPRGSND